MNQDPYFERSEVSNSDLTELEKDLMPKTQYGDIKAAYRFGTLLDAIVTEPHRVNFLQRTCDGEQFNEEEFDLAKRMKVAFLKSDIARDIMKIATFQEYSISKLTINYSGYRFSLDARCKWDFLIRSAKMGADLKSTVATSQKQFDELIKYFKYHRQGAWYMDLEKTDRHLIIGVSKKNLQVFHTFIKRDDILYNMGKQDYEYLAFKYHTMYDRFFMPDPEVHQNRYYTNMYDL